MNDKVISVRNIHKEFKLTRQQKKKMGLDNDKVIAVDNISFDIYKGEIERLFDKLAALVNFSY